jgi:hypothetical protein
MLGCFNLTGGTSRSDWLLGVPSVSSECRTIMWQVVCLPAKMTDSKMEEYWTTFFLWWNEKVKYLQRIEKHWCPNLRFFEQLRTTVAPAVMLLCFWNASVVRPISVNCRMFRTTPHTPNIHTQSHGRKWSKITNAEDGITMYTVTVSRHTSIGLLSLRMQSLKIRTLPDGAGIFVL